MPALSVGVGSALTLLAVALLAGCGGKAKTATVTATQTVVRTVTAPPAGTSPTTPSSTSATTRAPTGPRSCGRIDVSYPNGEGGSSAIGILATGLGCSEARAVTRTCQRGNVTPGWRASVSTGGGAVMTSGSKRITFRLAGGGGCAS